jgi:hypothetical protein
MCVKIVRMLRALMGKPAVQESALAIVLCTLDDAAGQLFRRGSLPVSSARPCRAGFFKQSTIWLHSIADMLLIKSLRVWSSRFCIWLALRRLRHPSWLVRPPFAMACLTSEGCEAAGVAIYAVLLGSPPSSQGL